MKRLLVTGDRGFLGSRVRAAMSGEYQILTLPPQALRGASRETVARLIGEAGADMIIHTAALSDTGYCRAHEWESRQANVLLPLYLAQACPDARLILFSSDQVYHACEGRGPFRENEDVRPTDVYARHKREMELLALDARPDCVILRAGWMYDLPHPGMPVHDNLLMKLLHPEETPRFSENDFRGVTWTRPVTDNLKIALSLPGGIYNFGAENDENMRLTAQKMLKKLGRSDEVQASAGKPRSLLMDGEKGSRMGLRFESTLAGFETCLRAYGLWKG